jgi:hypothetical protein
VLAHVGHYDTTEIPQVIHAGLDENLHLKKRGRPVCAKIHLANTALARAGIIVTTARTSNSRTSSTNSASRPISTARRGRQQGACSRMAIKFGCQLEPNPYHTPETREQSLAEWERYLAQTAPDAGQPRKSVAAKRDSARRKIDRAEAAAQLGSRASSSSNTTAPLPPNRSMTAQQKVLRPAAARQALARQAAMPRQTSGAPPDTHVPRITARAH